jgi:hypothetical protein
VTDSATLSNAFQATGTVTYEYFNGLTCSGPGTTVGAPVTVTDGIVPDSPSRNFNSAGKFSWNALYSGDINNVPAISACEPLTVTIAGLSITLTVSASALKVGSSLTLTASLIGGFQSTGTLAYDYVVGSACPSTTPKTFGTVTITDGAVPNLVGQTVDSAGIYRIYAVYGGDSNNNPTTSSCQTVTVSPVLSAPTSLTIGAGSTVHFMVNATDPDSTQPIQLNVNNRPSGASFASSQSSSTVSSLFTWTPTVAGDYNVTFTAEAGGVTTSLQVTIHVNAAAKTAPLPILQYSIFGIVGFVIVLIAAVILRRFQNPKRKLN